MFCLSSCRRGPGGCPTAMSFSRDKALCSSQCICSRDTMPTSPFQLSLLMSTPGRGQESGSKWLGNRTVSSVSAILLSICHLYQFIYTPIHTSLYPTLYKPSFSPLSVHTSAHSSISVATYPSPSVHLFSEYIS